MQCPCPHGKVPKSKLMRDATYEWNLIGNVVKIVKTQVSFHNHGEKKPILHHITILFGGCR